MSTGYVSAEYLKEQCEGFKDLIPYPMMSLLASRMFS